jgi:histidinol-phosphatase
VSSAPPDLRLALDLADAAGAVALERFRATDLGVEAKADGSPVTDADRAAERLIRERLAAERPTHAILGEEEGATGDSPWRWLLDPIDGTAHFAAGRPWWTTFVALEHEGVGVAAAIVAPALGRRWWAARGRGAYADGRRLQVSGTARLEHAVVHDDWSGALARGDAAHPASALAATCAGRLLDPRDGFPAVAEGRADVCLGVSGRPWDFAATRLLVEEAGGRFSDLDGVNRIDSGHAIVSNGRLHDAALAVVQASRSRSSRAIASP